MSVAFDASSEAHTGTTGSASEASFSWSHGGASSGVKGVLVYVWTNADSGLVSSVTYGGVTVPAVSGGEAADTAGEPGRCAAYFLGSGVPQGTQTVVVNRTNNATIMSASAITVLANQDTKISGPVVLTTGDAAVAEVAVTDLPGQMTGVDSMRFAAGHFGHQTPPTQGANSSALQTLDIGATCFVTVRETTAGTGSRNVGMTNGTADDRAIVSLAISETYSPPTGALSLVGAAALLAFGLAIPSGAVAFTGYAPTVSIGTGGVVLEMPAGSVAYQGYAPGIAFIGPTVGTVQLTGYAPTLARGIDLPAGSVALTGYAPTVLLPGTTIAIPAGELTLTGQYVGIAFLPPAAGEVVFTGYAPTVVIGGGNVAIGVPVGTVQFTGTASALSFGLNLPAGSLQLTGVAPAGAFGVSVPTGTIALTGLTPALAFGISLPAGSVALVGLAPNIGGGTLLSMPVGGVTLTGLAPSLAFGVAVPAGTLTLTGLAPSIGSAVQIAVPVGSLDLTGRAPALGFGIVLPVGSIVLTGAAPNIGGGLQLSLPVGQITLTGQSPTLRFGLALPLGTLTLTGLAPLRVVDTPRPIPGGTLTLTGYAPTLLMPLIVAVPPGSLAFVGFAPALVETGPTSFGPQSRTQLGPTAGPREMGPGDGYRDLGPVT